MMGSLPNVSEVTLPACLCVVFIFKHNQEISGRVGHLVVALVCLTKKDGAIRADDELLHDFETSKSIGANDELLSR
jgi:hypothetical protein